MAVKYLGRKVNVKGVTNSPCAQLVNVPELQRNQRCIYCHYWQSERTTEQVEKCILSHNCGVESLLYAPLINSQYAAPIPDDDHFSPSPLVYQTEIDSQKRYLQLWSCDIQGYQCCKLCHFYPERIEKQQTIAACSNSHNCGQNASWFDLLQIRDTILYSMPAYNEIPPADNQIVFLDGTVRTIYLGDIYYDAGGLALAHLSDDSYAYIMNFVDWQPGCGALLATPWDVPYTWSFKATYNLRRTYDRPIALIRSIRDQIGQMLIAKGLSETALHGSLGYQFSHRIDASTRVYFAERQYTVMFRSVLGKLLPSVFEMTGYEGYHFRFGSTNWYLTSPYMNAPPSKWQRAEINPDEMAEYPIISIPDANSVVAKFLLSIGVRDSLFNIIR